MSVRSATALLVVDQRSHAVRVTASSRTTGCGQTRPRSPLERDDWNDRQAAVPLDRPLSLKATAPRPSAVGNTSFPRAAQTSRGSTPRLEMRGTQGTRCRRSVMRLPMQPGSFREGPAGRRIPAYRARLRRFAAPGSADRSRPQGRSSQAAALHMREPRKPPAPYPADTTSDAVETSIPLARALERDGGRHTLSSSFPRRTRRRSARSPMSQCPRARTTAGNDAAATRPPEVAQGRAGDVVLRASTNAAALGEREPVTRVEPEPEGEDENRAGRWYRARAGDGQRQQHARAARHRCHSGP